MSLPFSLGHDLTRALARSSLAVDLIEEDRLVHELSNELSCSHRAPAG